MIYRASVLVHLRRLVRGGRSDAPGAVVDLLGRVGLVSYGLVHLLVGWLAFMAAFGVPDASADAQGAVAAIADTAFGAVVLVLVTAGLLVLALVLMLAVPQTSYYPILVLVLDGRLTRLLRKSGA